MLVGAEGFEVFVAVVVARTCIAAGADIDDHVSIGMDL